MLDNIIDVMLNVKASVALVVRKLLNISCHGESITRLLTHSTPNRRQKKNAHKMVTQGIPVVRL